MLVILPSLKRLTTVQAVVQRGVAAADELFDVLDTAVEADTGTMPLQRSRGEIEFDGVRLQYGGSSALGLYLTGGAGGFFWGVPELETFCTEGSPPVCTTAGVASCSLSKYSARTCSASPPANTRRACVTVPCGPVMVCRIRYVPACS